MCLVSIELNCTIYIILYLMILARTWLTRSLNQFRFKKKIKKELI
jgi:hypothetical protein